MKIIKDHNIKDGVIKSQDDFAIIEVNGKQYIDYGCIYESAINGNLLCSTPIVFKQPKHIYSKTKDRRSSK